MLLLRQLISHNGTPAAVPPVDSYARKRVFQNAYAIETHSSLTQMASNIDTSCQEVAAGHLENTGILPPQNLGLAKERVMINQSSLPCAWEGAVNLL